MESDVRMPLKPYLSLSILIPVENGENEIEQLKAMVCEVNHTELTAEEVLSDSIYLFKRNSGIITKMQ